MTQTNIYYIDHSKTCELAHKLLIEELRNNKLDILNLEIDEEDENGEVNYKPYYQAIFDKYVNMIEDIMLGEEIQKESIEVDISEEDMEDLRGGKTFNWTFDGKYLPVDIKLTN